MRTAVDSSVLLDVVTNDPRWADPSEAALRQAQVEGSLLVCETVVAEVRPALSNSEFVEFLSDWDVHFVPGTVESALLAGELFDKHLRRNPERQAIVPDLLVGAHAKIHADRLLARDRGYLRDYFRDLHVWIPRAA